MHTEIRMETKNITFILNYNCKTFGNLDLIFKYHFDKIYIIPTKGIVNIHACKSGSKSLYPLISKTFKINKLK